MANIIKVGVTEDGFINTDRTTIYNAIADRLVAAFGSYFDTSEESPDGQVIGVVADLAKQCLDVAEEGYSQYNPNTAYSTGLDQIAILNNVKRFIDTPTTVTLVLDGVSGTNVSAGSKVKEENDNVFTLNDDVILPASVTATCTMSGAITIDANMTWTIVDEVTGWDSVINPEAGYAGIDYEQDAALRARRANSTIINGTGPIDAIYNGLAKLGLEFITIIDNDTEEDVDGQPPGTIQVIVKSGTPSEIALAIYQEKGTGIRTYGTTSQTVIDSNGYPKVIKFSRPIDTTIYAVVNMKRLKGSSNNSATLVQTACIDYINQTKIGSIIVWSDLLSYIASEVDLVSIKSLFIGRTANPTLADDIDLVSDEKAVAATTGVIVNVLA